MRGAADTADRLGHVLLQSGGERERKDKRGEEGRENGVERGGKRRGASNREERGGVKKRWDIEKMKW